MSQVEHQFSVFTISSSRHCMLVSKDQSVRGSLWKIKHPRRKGSAVEITESTGSHHRGRFFLNTTPWTALAGHDMPALNWFEPPHRDSVRTAWTKHAIQEPPATETLNPKPHQPLLDPNLSPAQQVITWAGPLLGIVWLSEGEHKREDSKREDRELLVLVA